MIAFAIMSAMPEFVMALLMAKAQAMVIKMSHEMYFVYFRAGKILAHAMMTAVTAAKKNMSSFNSGKVSWNQGSSPTVAPTIISTSKNRANVRLRQLTCGSLSCPLAIIRKTEESPHVFTNESSAKSTNVSPSYIGSCPTPLAITFPPRLISFTSAP